MRWALGFGAEAQIIAPPGAVEAARATVAALDRATPPRAARARAVRRRQEDSAERREAYASLARYIDDQASLAEEVGDAFRGRRAGAASAEDRAWIGALRQLHDLPLLFLAFDWLAAGKPSLGARYLQRPSTRLPIESRAC